MSRRGGRRSIRHKTRCLMASKPMAQRPNGVTHGRRHVLNLERLHQARDLHELALALLAHARFQQAAQGGELLRQLPASQGRSLVERVDLLLEQGEVMQRVKHEVLALVGAWMTCDHLGAALPEDLPYLAL